jgi:metal-responsive CopG/Arc/MetJ family transcriptional regulator
MEVERISKERGESPTNTIREAIREYIKNYKVGGE